MSYLVLARKWRPTHFDEVVGQGHVTQTLKNAIELNRVAHALLFTGSRGIGKTSCARILAKSLNCKIGPTVSPCGECPSCQQIISGTSVDVFEIDGASNNSVEQIREIRESVKFMPTHGRRKIYIIDEVHMLSTSAFNALLKTLEEPPEHVLFIFATTEPHKIPDTIISRCQRYDFKRIPERIIVDALMDIAKKESLEIEEEALFHVAREAQGGMRDSLSLLDQVIAFCGLSVTEAAVRDVLGIADRAAFVALTQALLDGSSQAVLELIDAQYRRGLDLQKFSAEFVRHVRDLMVLRVVEHPERLVDMSSDQLLHLKAQISSVQPARLHRMLSTLLKGAEEVSRSAFPKLALEMLLLRLCQQGSTLPIAEVLAGIERLETRLRDVPDVDPSPVEAPEVQSREVTQASAAKAVVEQGSLRPESAPGVPQGTVEIASNISQSEHTRPPWEPSGLSTPSNDQNTNEAQSDASAAHPDSDSTQSDGSVVTPQEQRQQDNPSVVESEQPAVVSSPQSPDAAQSQNESNRGSGLKSRPDGEGEYDDLSGGPPTPIPISQLRPLAVKPRTPLAISADEVRPFLRTSSEQPQVNGDHVQEDGSTPKDAASDDAVDGSGTIQGPGGPLPATSTPDANGGPQAEVDSRPTTKGSSRQHGAASSPLQNISGEPMEMLTQLLERVQARDAFLGSELTQCLHLQEINARRLKVVAVESTWRTIGASAESLLTDVSREAFGADFAVDIELCTGGDSRTQIETVFDRKRRLAKEREEMRIEQAKRDPNVVLAQRFLDAEVVNVELKT
ncbi:MAG: DNA polymerase III subunit gamma/tau [Bradymonadia bacterium]